MTPAVPQESNYTLSEYEGWRRHAEGLKRVRPEPRDLKQLEAMDRRDRLIYDEQRRIWHANMGPYLTPEMGAVMEDWDVVVQANRQDGDRVRSSLLLDAYPGLGKTTLAVQYAATFHRDQIDIYGEHTESGHVRVPVAYISLPSNTTMKSLNSAICRFYAHPSAERGSAAELGTRAAICARESQTRLIVCDDIHFLDVNRRDGREVANHLKWLASEFQATFLFVGVGIGDRGLLTEGLGPARSQFAQIARRWTATKISPFTMGNESGRTTWRRLLKAIERDVVLARNQPGMLVESLDEYLFARSTGHFQSLMSLITRGCAMAIKTQQEELTTELLDRVRVDAAAEHARQRVQTAFASSRLRTGQKAV